MTRVAVEVLRRFKRSLWTLPRKLNLFRHRIIGRGISCYLRHCETQPDWKSIPVIINNFNRYQCLIDLVDWLRGAGMERIVIIDNDSTFPPTLDYYKTTSAEVILLKKNLGHRALWTSGIVRRFYNNYFIYTDPDVVPSEECPQDAVAYFYALLRRHPWASKVGFGLRIDDLPSVYSERDQVIEWESQFWKAAVEPDVYSAPIDTTFAIYRPRSHSDTNEKAIRTGLPYVARHIPWYTDSHNLSEEERYYRAAVSPGATWWSSEKLSERAVAARNYISSGESEH